MSHEFDDEDELENSDSNRSVSNRYFNLDQLVEVEPRTERDFARIRETLTRVGHQGVNLQGKRTLEQICYILHKQDRYFITHIKEMQKMDGDQVDITEKDIGERNLIVNLLLQWNLINVPYPDSIRFPVASPRAIRVISHNAKAEWELVSNYEIGKYKRDMSDEY